jgi:PAS domain S-box-containing protein
LNHTDDGNRRRLASLERRLAQAEAEAAAARAELERERRMRAIFESVALGVAEVGTDGRIQDVNQRFCELLGYDGKQELLGRSIHELTAPEDRARSEDLNGRLLRGELDRFGYEKRYLQRDGRRLWVHVTVSALRDAEGRVVRGVGTIEDITERRRTDEALREALALHERQVRLFDSIASTTPDFVYLFDREGRFRYANRRLLEVWGMRLADAVGKTCRELGYEQWHHDMHMREIAQVIETRQSIKGEVPFRAPLTGIFGVYEYIFTPVIGPDGEVELVAGTTRDVTDRKRAEESARGSAEALRRSERQYRTLAENAPEVIARFDRELRHTYVNEYGAKVYGRARREVIGRTSEELGMPPGLVAFWREQFERVFASGEQATVDFEFESPTYGHRFFSALFVPERDDAGDVTSVLAITRDVTSVRSAEDALRRSVTELRQAQARLQEADRRKDEFLAVLSHELRNPLAPIKNSLYVLERAAPGGEQARRAHEVIARQVVHMTRLVDDLLDVTRISRGKAHVRREPMDLCEVVTRTAEDHRSIFLAVGVALEISTCETPLMLDADPTRLSQVIGNLLSNAAKFTAPGGRVSLSLEREAGEAAIRVRDDGAGITAELLPRVFEPFVQDDATLDRSKGGLGLGLALVKGLVELHGGTVTAASAGPGRGAEFLVRLPLAAGEPAGAEPERPVRVASRPLRVLVIEDNDDAAQTLRDALALNGIEIETSPTGPAGIDRARALRPDVVLCDIGLPGIDGYEVARRMRADPELRDACLVALSGYAAPDDLERSREAGFVRHFAKPPDIASLVATLEELSSPGGDRAIADEGGGSGYIRGA